MKYYYLDKNRKCKGPVEAAYLPQCGVTMDSFVWTKGMKNWERVRNVNALKMIYRTYQEHELVIPQANVRQNLNAQSTKIDSGPDTSLEFANRNESDNCFSLLMYSLLCFTAAGLLGWLLVNLFSSSGRAHVKVAVFIAPIYCVWYGVKYFVKFIVALFS